MQSAPFDSDKVVEIQVENHLLRKNISTIMQCVHHDNIDSNFPLSLAERQLLEFFLKSALQSTIFESVERRNLMDEIFIVKRKQMITMKKLSKMNKRREMR